MQTFYNILALGLAPSLVVGTFPIINQSAGFFSIQRAAFETLECWDNPATVSGEWEAFYTLPREFDGTTEYTYEHVELLNHCDSAVPAPTVTYEAMTHTVASGATVHDFNKWAFTLGACGSGDFRYSKSLGGAIMETVTVHLCCSDACAVTPPAGGDFEARLDLGTINPNASEVHLGPGGTSGSGCGAFVITEMSDEHYSTPYSGSGMRHAGDKVYLKVDPVAGNTVAPGTWQPNTLSLYQTADPSVTHTFYDPANGLTDHAGLDTEVTFYAAGNCYYVCFKLFMLGPAAADYSILATVGSDACPAAGPDPADDACPAVFQKPSDVDACGITDPLCITTTHLTGATGFDTQIGTVTIAANYRIAFDITAVADWTEFDKPGIGVFQIGTSFKTRQPRISMRSLGAGKVNVQIQINCDDWPSWDGMYDIYFKDLDWTIGQTYHYEFTVNGDCVRFTVDGCQQVIWKGPNNLRIREDCSLLMDGSSDIGTVMDAWSFKSWGEDFPVVQDASPFLTLTNIEYQEIC